MTQQEAWPRIAVVGAGAVGGYFGGMLARAGAPVVLIGRPAFVEAVNKNGLRMDTLTFKETVRAEASTQIEAARGADIVLFCVKTTGTDEAVKKLAPLLGPNSIVASLQNGVDNAQRIRAASGIEALSTVVYVGAAAPEPGLVHHGGRGDLVTGPRNAKSERFAAIFERAQVPCRIADNIQTELWTKFIGNCATNAISALARAKYAAIAASEDTHKMIEGICTETLAVANALKVPLPEIPDAKTAMNRVIKGASQMADTYSSTAQDLMRGKRTEIDSLNGYVARRGAELGIPTPINHSLFTLIKLAGG